MANETIADVVREMRKYPNEWADRIEAAHKEETAAKDATVARLTEALKQIADSHGDLISWVSSDGRNLGAGVCTYAREVLAAEGGEK